MLGSMIVDYLSREAGISLTASVRNADLQARMQSVYPKVRWEVADFRSSDGFDSFDRQRKPGHAEAVCEHSD